MENAKSSWNCRIIVLRNKSIPLAISLNFPALSCTVFLLCNNVQELSDFSLMETFPLCCAEVAQQERASAAYLSILDTIAVDLNSK